MPATVQESADWRRRSTVDVPTAGRLLGISRNTAYAAASRGELPALRMSGRLLVPVAALRRLLGELPPLPSDAEVGA